MTSKQGVYRISNRDFESFAERRTGSFQWRRFGRKDELPSDECHGEQNQPTLCQTSDGRIWIPTAVADLDVSRCRGGVVPRLGSHLLRPLELDRLGLHDAIEALLREVSATTGLRVFKDLDAPDALLAPEIQVYLYRLVQEGLNNVIKHARASTVMLEIKRDNGHISIRLEDDGAGFDLTRVQERRQGLGLIGMEERVKLVGGQFEISSAPGAGTRIGISIPLPV